MSTYGCNLCKAYSGTVANALFKRLVFTSLGSVMKASHAGFKVLNVLWNKAFSSDMTKQFELKYNELTVETNAHMFKRFWTGHSLLSII